MSLSRISKTRANAPVSRRSALGRMAGLSALPLAALLPDCALRTRTPGLEYAHRLHAVLDTFRTREDGAIRDAANLFAQTIVARNLCFLAAAYPLNPGYLSEDTPGLPRAFVFLRSREMAETLRPGDAVLVTAPGELSGIARVHGAKLVGITSPAVSDDYTPDERQKLAAVPVMGETMDQIIRTRLPVWDGLVTIPEYPFGILPGSGVVELAVVTALAGEVYRRSEGTVHREGARARDALEFLKTVMNRIRKLDRQRAALNEAAELTGNKVKNRGSLWVYDRQGALARELGRGAGTPLFARPISREQITDGTLRAIDGLVFASLETNLPEDLHLIRMARGVTNAIVTICPRIEGGGYRIYNEAPAGLDNGSPEKDGVRKFDRESRTYLHTGGILNGTLFWMLIGEITGRLIKDGDVPCCLMGSHLAGNVEYNAAARATFQKRGF